MLTVTARPGATLSLGREGENLARKIVFDVSRWQAEYGPGSVSLIAQRQGDTDPYPCAITVDGVAVTWTITAADSARCGFGKCELQYRVDDVLVKSASWRTFTADALGKPTPEPPQPQQAWVDKVLEAGLAAQTAAGQANSAAERAESAAVNPPKIGDDGTWLVWDFGAGEYVDTGVAAAGPAGEPGQQGNPGPQGKPGQQGPHGEPGYTPQLGVDYWTTADQQAIVDSVLAHFTDVSEVGM